MREVNIRLFRFDANEYEFKQYGSKWMGNN